MCQPTTSSGADAATIERKRREKALVDEEIANLRKQIVELRNKLPQRNVEDEVVLSSCPQLGTAEQCIRIVNVSSVTKPAQTSAVEQRTRLRMARVVGHSLGIGNDIVEAQARLPPVLTAVEAHLWTNRVQSSALQLHGSTAADESPHRDQSKGVLFLDCIRVRRDLAAPSCVAATLSSCAPHRHTPTRAAEQMMMAEMENECLSACEITTLSPPNTTRLGCRPPAYVPRRAPPAPKQHDAEDSVCCSAVSCSCSAGRILPCLRAPFFQSALL